MSSRAKYKEDPYVVCPYYHKESSVEVRCEGLCGSATVHYFESGNEKKEFKDNFCQGFYWNCPCAIALQTDGK